MRYGNLFSTWTEVDLKAIAGNVEYIAHKTGSQVMAIVKANAYGHGTVPVAQAALRAGATWLGVSRVEEALELRKAGIESPVLLLGYTPPGRLEEMITHRISLVVWSQEQLTAMSAAAARAGEKARLHLKVDTGMNRLGVQPDKALLLGQALADTSGVISEGLFTHFARADEPKAGATEIQEESFQKVLQAFQTNGLAPGLIHAANSAASLGRESAYCNLVRLGLVMYGLLPSTQFILPPAIRPALEWKTVISQIKTVPPGQGISYGHVYTTSGYERIGTLPVGYADGFRRMAGNQVLIHGKHIPVVGRVCMDQIMVKLDLAPEAYEGDEVVLIGNQGEGWIRAEQVAERWGTINYEVTCAIGARVPRVYT